MTTAPIEAQRSAIPREMVFQGKWRTYQARLLENLDIYLEDDRVHIVAAPGCGKTVFGLEVVRRIKQRTLVLAPTITIRDQWAGLVGSNASRDANGDAHGSILAAGRVAVAVQIRAGTVPPPHNS